MSALAHVFEQAGLATVGISLVRGQAVKSRPPRMLHCEFPLGRPLGRPGDPAFQHRVLAAAFALLERVDVPVLVDFPETITDESDAPLACSLPPRHDAGLHPAIDELLGLVPVWRRRAAGATAVSAVVDVDRLRAQAEVLVELAAGAAWERCGASAEEIGAAGVALRAFYEEVALELAGHTPAARQSESWLYRSTEAGLLLHRARHALQAQRAPRPAWFPLVPIGQTDPSVTAPAPKGSS